MGIKFYDSNGKYWGEYDETRSLFIPSEETVTQTETQNSNLTFEKRTMRDCYNCKRYETEGECIECHYEPKDEPQDEYAKEYEELGLRKLKELRKDEPQTEPLHTCSVNGRPYSECSSCENFKCTADEPQTDCPWK